MNGWLESYAFHIVLPWWVYGVAFVLLMCVRRSGLDRTGSIRVYGVAFVLLMCVAFLTVVRQVWRVVRLKPMRILRNE